MTTISPLPTPPTAADPSSFRARADAFFAALVAFVTQANAQASENNTAAQTCTTKASESASSASAAAGSASTASGAASTASAAAASASTSAGTATTKAAEAASSAAAAAASAAQVDFSAPPPMGVGTPNVGAFSELRVGSTSNIGGGRIDATAAGANAVLQARASTSGAGQTVRVVRAVDSAGGQWAHARSIAQSFGWGINGSDADNVTLDGAGNIGMAGAPTAFGAANLVGIQIKNGIVAHNWGSGFITNNAAYTTGDYVPKRIVSGAAQAVVFNRAGGNDVQILVAPSGAAGEDISFTRAMTFAQGTTTASQPIQMDANDVKWNEVGVRSWAMYPLGGNLQIGSGDGAAALVLGVGLSISKGVTASNPGGVGTAIQDWFSPGYSHIVADMNVVDSPRSTATAATLRLGHATGNGRSFGSTGTINASGADYAEYESNGGVRVVKGQVVGFDAHGTLTLTFAEALRFAVKSTSPNLVGGDTWGTEDKVGKRPDTPKFVPPAYAGRADPGEAPMQPQPPVAQVFKDADGVELVLAPSDAAQSAYAQALADYETALAEYDRALFGYTLDQQVHAANVEVAQHLFDTATWPEYERALAAFEERLESARKGVDRIAYCGKVPCNILGATPGDYIVPVAAEDGGIAPLAVADADITFEQYRRAVGRVNKILPDGRAEIAVIVH